MADCKDSLLPTIEAANRNIKALDKEIKNCKKQYSAKVSEYRGQKKVEQYKICELVKAHNTNDLYSSMKFYVTDGSAKQAELLKGKVDALIETKGALNAALVDLMGLVKDVKTKMTEAADIACRLPRSITEEKRCNVDIYNQLLELDPDWEQIKGTNGFKSRTSQGLTKINTITNVLVDEIGIQHFSNPSSLTPYSDALVESLSAFKQDVDDNIASSQANMDAAGTALSTEIEDLAQIHQDLIDIGPSCQGKEKLREHVKMVNDPQQSNCAERLSTAVNDIVRICSQFHLRDNEEEITTEVVPANTEVSRTPARRRRRNRNSEEGDTPS